MVTSHNHSYKGKVTFTFILASRNTEKIVFTDGILYNYGSIELF